MSALCQVRGQVIAGAIDTTNTSMIPTFHSIRVIVVYKKIKNSQNKKRAKQLQ